MSADIYLGLIDWGASAVGFYPEELPEEWREAYYTNRFSCVWLSRAVAEAVTPAEAERWLADVPASFRFLIEGGVTPNALRPQAVVPSGREIWFDSATDLKALAETMRIRGEMEPLLFLLSRDGNQQRADQVRTLIELLGL
jgi:hypothetical protein